MSVDMSLTQASLTSNWMFLDSKFSLSSVTKCVSAGCMRVCPMMLVSGGVAVGEVRVTWLLFRMHWNFDGCEHFLEKAKDHYLKMVRSNRVGNTCANEQHLEVHSRPLKNCKNSQKFNIPLMYVSSVMSGHWILCAERVR